MQAVSEATESTPLVPPSADKDVMQTTERNYNTVNDDPSLAKAPDDVDLKEDKSWIFPFNLCCFPPITPKTWRWIVSFPHLVLAVGIFMNFFIIGDTLYNWHQYGCRMKYCPSRIIPLVFVSSCTTYFMFVIEQYDATLTDKKEQIKQKKEEVFQKFQATVCDLDGLMSKATNTQAFLSERTFESKRRAFLRFLQRLGPELKNPDGPGLLKNFRSFVLHWLSVFSECSIKPSDEPLMVLSSENDLTQCRTATEVADVVAERLKVVEVDFIQDHLEEDTRSMTAALESISHMTAQTVGLEDADPEKGSLETHGAGLDHAGEVAEKLRWVQWGFCCPGFSCSSKGCWPFKIHLGFVTIVILSQEHFNLLVGFCIGCFGVGFELFVFKNAMKKELVAELSVSLLCVAFVLYDFVDIDIVQQLEAELFELQQAQADVHKKQNDAKDFYERTRELTDLWLHRTLPRMLLLHNMHEEFLHTAAERLLPLLAEVNTKLDALEKSLPALKLWENEETIKAKKKKIIGNTLMRLASSDFATALQLMPETAQAIENETQRLLKKSRQNPAIESETALAQSSARPPNKTL